MLTAEVEKLPVVGKFERRHAVTKLWVENRVVLEDEQGGRVAPLGRAHQKSKREAVGALRQSRESFPSAEPARIDRAEPIRRDARIGHARLEPATAILPARQADVGAMRKDGVEIHIARATSTTTRTPPR